VVAALAQLDLEIEQRGERRGGEAAHEHLWGNGEWGVGRRAPWWARACERRVGSGAQVGRRGEHLALRLEHGAVPVGRERACARRGEHMHAERTGGRLERAVVSTPW
jgi:hypothetical protein